MKIPHGGYHWDNISDNFFEGWYYRVTLPKLGETFAFMYSLEDPTSTQIHSGGAVQILGAKEEYLCRTFPDVRGFWAQRNRLALGHWRKHNLSIAPQLLAPEKFDNSIVEGYQATESFNQGFILDPARDDYCRWYYQIKPIYFWGNPTEPQKPTGGGYSYLPIFEPGWQVLMAHGLATGWIDWYGKRYEFTDAPAYSEKNWGRSFPEKWFWLNCNSFEEDRDLALTAAGGKRDVLWWSESVGLIGIHYRGQFYEFAPGNAQINWQVEPWGRWEIEANNDKWHVHLLGTTQERGTYVRVPTAEGLKFICRDTTKGNLQLELKECKGRTIVRASSCLAGLEIGGLS